MSKILVRFMLNSFLELLCLTENNKLNNKFGISYSIFKNDNLNFQKFSFYNVSLRENIILITLHYKIK